jgi:translation initiation factor IF-1
MAKEDFLKTTGRIIEILPNTLFKIKLENDHIILGHLAGKLRVNNVNIILNDLVDVEISPYDLTKCRITWRHKRDNSFKKN